MSMTNLIIGIAVGVVVTLAIGYGLVIYAIKKAAEKNAKRF